MIILILGLLLAAVSASSTSENKESYKNQFHNSASGHAGKHKGKHENFSSEYCTDPRTMKKHPAYTEWADAYSCTRHRCQPGGRNLAIYTVGCKRVEAPESAIECEEVVEDTNMQFPFCCTRLRCLVVVRGEVWTRVLGQPWEVLPAAPWSHMYKMKKPPPADSTFLPKTVDQGPVYELSENESDQGSHDKVLRSGKEPVTDNTDYNEIAPVSVPRTVLPPPDIVIALSTNEGKESSHNKISHKRRKSSAQPPAKYFEEETENEKQPEPVNQELEELPTSTEKLQETEAVEEENENKPPHKSHNIHNPVSWTEIPQNQWNEPREAAEIETRANEHHNNHQPQEAQPEEPTEMKQEALQIAKKNDPAEKPSNLQALVDAIGTRMKDIESVVQKMSDKVHHAKPTKQVAEGSNEKRMSAEPDGSHKRRKEFKRRSEEDESYRRFNVRKDRGSKYLHSSTDSTTDKPLFVEDTKLTGYFSDASNSIIRRKNSPKEPAATYMAPVVETRRKAPVNIAVPEKGNDSEKKHKKRGHKKRRSKGSRSHKKHSRSKDDKRKHFNRLSSGDTEKNAVSLDDSSAAAQ